MRDIYRWGLATGLAAALALFGTAQAQAPGASTGNDTAAGRQSDQPSSTSGTSGTTSPDTTGNTSARGGSMDTSGSATSAQTGQTPQIKKKLSDDLERLHAVDQAEIHMGEMAEQQAQSQEVKDYGRKLAGDHKKLDEKLQSEARTLGVNLEGKEFQKAQKDAEKHMQKLQGKQGTDFDQEFVSMAEKDHKKDQKDVQKAAKEARNEKLETVAKLLDQADKGMQGHLDEAKRLKDVVKSEGRRQGRRGAARTGSSSEAMPGTATPSGSPSGSTGAGTNEPSTGMGSQPGSSGMGQPGSDTGSSSTGSESGRKY